MANLYSYNVVTVAGAALIAQATAANPIVYVAALSKATAAESDADLATKPASWYDGKTGEIAAVSAVGNDARIMAVWRNSGAAQPAKSLAVTARLASQSDADAVVVTAMSDPDSTVILPGADDIQGGVEVPFNITLNASGTVEVTPGAAASIADLERFVSLYKAGNPNQGETQYIKGEKYFSQVCQFSGGIRAYGIECPDDVSVAGGVYTSGDISSGMDLDVFRNATVGGALHVDGNASAPNFTSKNTVSLYADNENDTTNATITLHSETTDDPYISAQLENSSGYTIADVSIDTDSTQQKCFLTMESDLYETCIGSPTSRIAHVYAGDLQGVIPHPETAGEPPVGCILWIAVYNSQAVIDIDFGDLIQGTGVYSVYIAQWDATTNAFAAVGTAFGSALKFRALCAGKSNASSNCFVLAIRVE